jgi:cytochrome c2
MRLLSAGVLVLFSSALSAEPFSDADPKAGEKLFKEHNCNGCHMRMLGGDGTQIFTRADRKVKSPSQLLSQLHVCNAQLGSGLFPEDEQNLAAYLNQRYYKFK